MNEDKPKRVCFNFLNVCNMDCPFCYLDFHGKDAGLSTWLKIIDRICEWGVRSVTIGGGDPLAYRDVHRLLDHCKKNDLFVQLDTNGLSFRDDHLKTISDSVDLIGISLDGHTQEINEEMRGHRRHFSKVISILEKRNMIESAVKINTVVGQANVGSLCELGSVLEPFAPNIWSLYQFWPIGAAAKANVDQYQISRDVFDLAVENLRTRAFPFSLEVSPYDKRHRTYFFVDQTGRSYTVDGTDVHNYAELGSVFAPEVLKRWSQHSTNAENSMRVDPRIKSVSSRMGDI